MKFLILVILFSIDSILCEEVEKSPVVSTEFGQVRGVKVETHFEYRGIPYAKPPIKTLRYKEAEDPNSWSDVYEANEFPSYCIQYNFFWADKEGVEDCLYLNVFTPNPIQNKSLPVFVYIHPGGFMFGRGSMFRPTYLMEGSDAVVVTFQYRLGSFGFLNLGDENSFGNFGLKDQNKVLKWVQKNILNFGGDPNSVTIFGTSAGGASVHYHILSPLSNGLFHRAISSSGSALCPWAFEPNPKKQALKLAQALNCPTSNNTQLVECLRTKNAEEIALKQNDFREWITEPMTAFAPSIEINSPNAFLTKDVLTIIKSNNFNKVPWIVGFNSDEGYDHAWNIFKHSELFDELKKNWNHLAPITYEFVNAPEDLKSEAADKILQFYFGGTLTDDKLVNHSNAYSDQTYNYGIMKSASEHANMGQRVYLQYFNYKGQNSLVNIKGIPSDSDFGANHLDDLQYLMESKLFPPLEKGTREKQFSQQYVKLIKNFAKHGTVGKFEDNGEEWLPLEKSQQLRMFHIKTNPSMEKLPNDLQKRYEFWDKLFLRDSSSYSNLNHGEL